MTVPGDPQNRTYAQLIARGMVLEAVKGSVAAFIAITDRTGGKPRQAVDLSVNQTEYERYKKMVDNLMAGALEHGIELSEEEAIERLGQVDEHIHEVYAVAAITDRLN
ncbi:MAG TPA: hypothetical protein VI756_14985 [Blastocatellia bacterium]